MSATSTSLGILPEELLYCVWDYLSFQDMGALPFVNREFRSIAPKEETFRDFARKRGIPKTFFAKNWAKTAQTWERLSRGRFELDPVPAKICNMLSHPSGHILYERASDELVWETDVPLALESVRVAKIFQEGIWGITTGDDVFEIRKEDIVYSENGCSVNVTQYHWVEASQATQVFGNSRWILTYTSQDSLWVFWKTSTQERYHSFHHGLPLHLDLGDERALFTHAIDHLKSPYCLWRLGEEPFFEEVTSVTSHFDLSFFKKEFLHFCNQPSPRKNTVVYSGSETLSRQFTTVLQTNEQSKILSGEFLAEELLISYVHVEEAEDQIIIWNLSGRKVARCDVKMPLEQPIRLKWNPPYHILIFSQGRLALLGNLAKQEVIQSCSPGFEEFECTQQHFSLTFSQNSYGFTLSLGSEQ